MDSAPGRLDESEIDLEQVDAALETVSSAAVSSHPDQQDFFIHRDGLTFAGTHLIVDLFGASRLDDPGHIEASLKTAAHAAGATVLSSRFHHFTPNGGVTGVLVLSESHISIHTWPERDFAAVDVFMCGDCRPVDTLETLREAFRPQSLGVNELRRGVMAA